MAILQRFLIRFPFLFGGTFIEALSLSAPLKGSFYFPSYVEGLSLRRRRMDTTHPNPQHFPSFSEGLSLRQGLVAAGT